MTSFAVEPPTKRSRNELVVSNHDSGADAYGFDHEPAIRLSSLTANTMKLTGHRGSVYCLAYDPTGENLVSGSFDMKCLLWNAGGDCENYNILEGHKNAVLDVAWSSDSEFIATASADKTIGWFDATTGVRVKRFQGHSGIVNAVDTTKLSASRLLASASDDCTSKLWDPRVRGATSTFEHHYQATSVALGDDVLYSAGLESTIDAWDIKTGKRLYSMKGHTDTITSLQLHPKGTHLLSNSMDGSLRSWDVQPFVTGKRHCKTFLGGSHNAEKGLLNCSWSRDGKMVSGGSADRMVHIWDELTSEELYVLPGHTGAVNCVAFHPVENVVASGSSDNSIFVGELG